VLNPVLESNSDATELLHVDFYSDGGFTGPA
jgi:hypothetical protein